MPLAPATGDQGQRYMIEAEGYPKEGWNPICFTNSGVDAVRMVTGIGFAPSCTATRLTDRMPKNKGIVRDA